MSKEYRSLPQDEDLNGDAGATSFPPSSFSMKRTVSQSPAAYLRVLMLGLGFALILSLAAGLGYCATSRKGTDGEVVLFRTEEAAPRLLHNVSFEETRPAPLTKLGYTADDAYDILPSESYEATLRQFVREVIPAELHERILSGLATFPSPLREVPISLFQTDKDKPPEEAWNSWNKLNPSINISFFDDAAALAEVERWFGVSEVTQVYKALEPVVLKADFLRYLMLLLRGGVYSDVDTASSILSAIDQTQIAQQECLKPIADWGQIDRQQAIFNDSSPHGQVANVVVGIEADVDDDGWDFMHHYWDDGLARPLQIVQWTMLSSTFHPIFLDTVRRIVERTRKIEQWRRKRDHELPYLGQSEAARRLREEPGWKQINHRFDRAICDWTGPGVFTDSVLSYLGHIEGVDWPFLHGTPWVSEPRLIGDVVVGPFITFRPYDEELPQAKAQHFFHNTWQHGHEDDMTHWRRRRRWESGHSVDECTLRAR